MFRPTRLLVLASALSFAVACGGPVADEDGFEITDATSELKGAPKTHAKTAPAKTIAAPASFDPFTAWAAARSAAARYAPGGQAVGLNGRFAGTDARGQRSYTWIWTVRGGNNVYVDVAVAPGRVRILNHQKRMMLVGVASFDPAKINVNAQDLAHLFPNDTLQSMGLSAPLTARPTAHWTVELGRGGTKLVDAYTGNIQ